VNQIDLLAIVQDFTAWQGNIYKLAAMVADAQRELDAQKCDDAQQPALAAAIRADAN